MGDFKSLEIVQYPKVGQEITDDSLYWKRLAFPVACKEYGSVNYVDISPIEPHHIAVTCSAKIQIYNSIDKTVQCSLSRFKKTAFGGVFRNDGKLLLAGSEDGCVRLFEVKSSKPLRIFKGHTAATHRCHFTKKGIQMVSFSDDKSVALWDIPTESQILKFEEHNDYIRAGDVSQSSADLFLSGSYDHMVKMYDARTSSPILSVDHGAPVESVLMFPTGGIFLSAGGTYVKVWDRIAGRLIAQVSQHHKTVTSLCFAKGGRHLMSASLDRHVKIYDVMSYKVVHTLDYPSPILSVACAPDDKTVVVGMADGLLSISDRKPEKTSSETETKSRRRKIHYQNRLYGTDFKAQTNDIFIPESCVRKQTKHDRLLKKFEVTRALDSVLTKHIQQRKPETTVSVMVELIRRGSLRAAMAGRTESSLRSLMNFITKQISNPKFTRILTDVGLILIEIYGPCLNDESTRELFDKFKKVVDGEVAYMKEMMEVQGIIQGILAVAHSNNIVEDSAIQVNGCQEVIPPTH